MREALTTTSRELPGQSGGYLEDSIPHPLDMYGMSKYLGEINDPPHLTIRTSFVGLPDAGGRGLLKWAAGQQTITGYDQVMWNGLTVNELGSIIFSRLIPQNIQGIVHLHGETLSKHDLLVQAKEVFGWDSNILKESEIESATKKHIENYTLDTFYPALQTKKSIREMLVEMKKQNGI